MYAPPNRYDHRVRRRARRRLTGGKTPRPSCRARTGPHDKSHPACPPRAHRTKVPGKSCDHRVTASMSWKSSWCSRVNTSRAMNMPLSRMSSGDPPRGSRHVVVATTAEWTEDAVGFPCQTVDAIWVEVSEDWSFSKYLP